MLITATNAVGALADKKKAPLQKNGRERLAVLDLEAKYGVEKAFAEGLSVIVRDAIHSYGQYVVMSQEDIRVVATREQLMQAIGCDDGNSECLLDFGRAIGSRFMVAGSILKFGTTFTVSLRMLDTNGDSAGIVNRVSKDCKCDEDRLIETVRNVSASLIGKQKSTGDKAVIATKMPTGQKTQLDKDEQKRIAEDKEKIDQAIKIASAEAAFILAGQKRKAALEKQQFVAETERLKKEKEIAAAESQKNKLALEQQKAEELEHQRKAEEEKLKFLAETERLINQVATAEVERANLIAELKKKEEETTRRLAEDHKKIKENMLKNLVVVNKKNVFDVQQFKKSNEKPKTSKIDRERISIRKNNIGIISEEELKRIIRRDNYYEKIINPNGVSENIFAASQGAEVVFDKRTGLLWQKNGSSEKKEYWNAGKYIQALNSSKYAGHSDWRLPSIEELLSLMKKHPQNDFFIDPIFSQDQTIVWSSDGAPEIYNFENETGAWLADFQNGLVVRAIWYTVYSYLSSDSLYTSHTENYVRAVCTVEELIRGSNTLSSLYPQTESSKSSDLVPAGDVSEHHTILLSGERVLVTLRSQPEKIKEPDLLKFLYEYKFFEKKRNISGSFANIFVDNGITVTDKRTGLMWQKNGSSSLFSYFRAKAYVKKLNNSKFGGFSDWRLPTLEELASLLEENAEDSTHVNKIFDTAQSKLWSADIPDNYSGYDQYGTNYILKLNEGYFVKAIFIKDSFSGEGTYSTNYENYVRAVRTLQKP